MASLTTIKSGDIVEVDGPNAKGSDGLAQGLTRYHALVIDNPGGRLWVRRLNGGRSFAVRARLVVGHWRKARRRN